MSEGLEPGEGSAKYYWRPYYKATWVDLDQFQHWEAAQEELLSQMPSQKVLPETQQAVLRDLANFVGEIMDETALKADMTPEGAFQNCMKALDRAEQKAFVLTNLMEALKSGTPLSDALKRYEEIGLIDKPVLPPAANAANAMPAVPDGPVLRRAMSDLKKVGHVITHCAAIALKGMAKATKVRPIIGLTGPFPTFHLEFELEGVELYEMLEFTREEFKGKKQ